jgi:hypothetical protein
MGEVESVFSGDEQGNIYALQQISELIRGLHEDNAMVTKFVLIVETIEEEDRYLQCFAAPNQKAWDTMGLLRYASMFEENFQAGQD